ncbi:unnamed protein product [Owenia fusiformis]|uniref:Charged multivesicular body protein 7 n=1 Tax=Owenia fusiformis TaxID=6347 RepID=A0A8S4NQS9_OWEFU|nr:unnamed protein product [Owenia fusiformis]
MENIIDQWNDNDFMGLMFSGFRKKEVNPKGWNQKMKFWIGAIESTMRHSNQFVFDVKDLPLKFKRDGKSPLCLQTVLQEMLRQGKILPSDEYQSKMQQGWVSWGYNSFVKKPISWGLSSLMGPAATTLQGQFVLVDLAKGKCEDVLQHLRSSSEHQETDDIFNMTRVKDLCRDVCEDGESLKLVLKQLQQQNKLVISIIQERKDKEAIVKIAKEGERSVSPVSEVDKGILRLQNTETKLEEEIETLSKDMERCRTDAKFYLGKGLRNSAKNALRRKKQMENLMIKRENALQNVQSLIEKIREAESQKMILDAYEAGTTAFKHTTAKHNLSVERIDDVMDELQEMNDTQADITEAISRGPTDPNEVSVTELEEELAELIANDDKENDFAKELDELGDANKSLNLPDVPAFEPIPSRDTAKPQRLPDIPSF